MATNLGKAYVQIVPSAKGISGSISSAIGKEASSAGSTAGTAIAGGIGSKLKGAVGALGLGAVVADAFQEGAALEQSLGGVETLFKKSADTVVKNADNAYRTSGLSANEYMEQVTSFSASLLQSLGGDTEKAASVADMAVTDMADNANKMGTSTELIQNAYQGFAKDNYTMLDNLKLGYGGTKTEMQRLLKDAEKISGQKYDISNLNDVYNAIHVIQEDLGITGTTAEEASETLSGSFESMKSAAKNLMADLVNGRDVESSLKGLLDTSVAFLFKNLVPAAMQVVKLLPGLAVQLVKEGVPALLKAIGDALPDMFNSLIEMVNNFGNMIIEWLDNFATNPSMQNEGIQMVVTIVKGLIEGIPRLADAIFKMQVKIVEAFVKAAPSMLKAGLHLIGSLAEGMWKGIKTKVKGVIDAIKDFFPIHIGKLLKGLQLPHFSLEWGTMDFGPLGKLNYPRTLGVNWYKSGGIFSSPTIAGIGEAGSEAVVPLDKLWEKFDQLSAIVERNSRTVNQTINFNTPVNSPIETARLLKNQQKLGLAGV